MSAQPALRVLSPPADLPSPEIATGSDPTSVPREALQRRVPHPEGLLAAYFAIERPEETITSSKALLASSPDAKSEPNLRAYNEMYALARGDSPPASMEFTVDEFRVIHAVLALRKLRPQIPQVGGFLADRADILAASGLHKTSRGDRSWTEFPSGIAKRRLRSLMDLASRLCPILVTSRVGKTEARYFVRYAPILKVSDLSTWDDGAIEAFPPQLHRARAERKFWIRLHPALETRFHRLLDEDYIERIERLKGDTGRVSSYEIAGVWWCYLQWKPELEIHRDKLARKLKIPLPQILRRPSALADRMRGYYDTWKSLGLLIDFQMGRLGRDGIKDWFHFNPDKLLHLREPSTDPAGTSHPTDEIPSPSTPTLIAQTPTLIAQNTPRLRP